jgi:pheromone shutdown protein TraB
MVRRTTRSADSFVLVMVAIGTTVCPPASSFVLRPCRVLFPANAPVRTTRAPTTLPALLSRPGLTDRHGGTAPAKSSVTVIDPVTDCEVVLLGCFHGAPSSSADVEACLVDTDAHHQPNPTDVIVLELCATRFTDLRRNVLAVDEKNNAVPTDSASWWTWFVGMVRQTGKTRGWSTGLAAAILGVVSGMQTALSGLEPGLEFATAFRIAAKREVDIVLADQPVEETLTRIGNLPRGSLELWKDWWHNGWENSFGPEASSLVTALAGDTSNAVPQVTLWGFLTRSEAALRDLARLIIPPFVVLQSMVLVIDQAAESLFPGNLELTTVPETDSLATVLVVLSANVISLALGYVAVALPAAKVILRERDDTLTVGIREACRVAQASAAAENRRGRVVAVLGLLHVNGVAQRLSKKYATVEHQSIDNLSGQVPTTPLVENEISATGRQRTRDR